MITDKEFKAGRRKYKNKQKQLKLLIDKFRVGVDENNITQYSFPHKKDEDKFKKINAECVALFSSYGELANQYSKQNYGFKN